MSESEQQRDATGVRNEELPGTAEVERFESMRLKYGFWLLVVSIVLVSLIFSAAAVILGDRFDSPAAVLSLISTVTTLIGTLVGFYFGAQIGASGYARAEVHRQETVRLAQQTAQRAVDALSNGSSANGTEVSSLIPQTTQEQVENGK